MPFAPALLCLVALILCMLYVNSCVTLVKVKKNFSLTFTDCAVLLRMSNSNPGALCNKI